jgi:hypothetical protein
LATKDADLKKKKKAGSEADMAESGDEAGSDLDEDEVWKVSTMILPP